MIDKDVLFIFGAPRSGTTYVNSLVREAFDVGLGPEGGFVVDFWKKRHQYGDLKKDENLLRLIEDVLEQASMFGVMREKYAPRFKLPMDFTPDDIRRHVPERNYPGFVYGVFAAVAEKMHRSRVGNKLPDFALHLDQLLEWFPRARFLHVMRDGRDVALSTFKQKWGEQTAYACARKWRKVGDAAMALEKEVPDQVHTVRYEEVLQQPAGTLEGLEAWLHVEVDPKARMGFVLRNERNPRRGNFGKWKTQMSEDDLRIFEAIAGDQLAHFGYETACERPTVSFVERVRYSGQELARRARGRLFSSSS